MPNLKDLLGSDQKLLLVGAGKMGTALLSGWLDAGLNAKQVSVLEPKPDTSLAGLGVSVNPDLTPHRVIVLAVKPQMASQILPTLTPAFTPDSLVVSLMAGIKLRQLEEWCGPDIHYVRTMPNTPASIGQGITALCGADVPSEKQLALALMTAVGETVWLDDESLMDAVTALSGSGPAYVFFLVEALAAAGRSMGLPFNVAMQLARQTVAGSGAMLAQSGLDVAALRENVTSPGGTTAAGLSVLMDDASGLGPLVSRVLQAAADRSRALASADGS